MAQDYGAKVSQPGYDVLTAAKERLIFSSAYDTFKVAQFGSGSVTIAAPAPFAINRGTAVISHSLGYKGAFFVNCNNILWATTDRFAPYTFRATGSPHNAPSFGIDASNLYITFFNPDPGGAHTFDYKYYIFYNQIA